MGAVTSKKQRDIVKSPHRQRIVAESRQLRATKWPGDIIVVGGATIKLSVAGAQAANRTVESKVICG